MRHLPAFAPSRLLAPLLLVLGCGYITGTSADASLGVSFYGSTPSLAPAVVELRVQTAHRSYLWVGGAAATPNQPQDFSPVGLQGGDSLTATAVLRTSQGIELARVVTGVRIQAHWLYGLGFQAGGVNPDARGGFCQQHPGKLAIPGFPGDTLFLWTSAIPEGAIC